MSATTTRRRSNGQASTEEATRAAALTTEQAIAEEAALLRGDTVGIDRALFIQLWPLLRRPIPGGFIKSIGVVTGKPYASTGITSVQVQIDRMDNVLTPLGWRDEVEYLEGGKVCVVKVQVLNRDGGVLVERESWGGVDRANTSGNLHKGSYTNAAKLAFARIGPGHEVYVGATDLDPDVHEGAANAQAPTAPTSGGGEQPLSGEAQQRVIDAFTAAGVTEDFGLYLKAVGLKNTEDMAASHAYKLRELLDALIAKAAKA